MSTPKMRGLKQMFITLKLYCNNTFVDGKKVEFAHQIGKGLQTRNNNNQQQFKDAVSEKSFWQVVLLYAVNGGRWGNEWQYYLGDAARNLKDPFHPGLPHPVLMKSKLPVDAGIAPKIQVQPYFSVRESEARGLRNIFDAVSQQEFVQLMQVGFGDPMLTWTTLHNILRFDIHHIKSFRFHDGLKSFGVDFSATSGDAVGKCVVKLSSGHVCEFTEAFLVQAAVGNQVLVMKGQMWDIQPSQTSMSWMNDFFTSMDCIDCRGSRTGWTFMNNIVEPVLLIHNCVPFGTVRRQLPEPWKSLDKFTYIRNSLYWSHRLQEYIATHGDGQGPRLEIPCGPCYQCKAHGNSLCMACKGHSSIYDLRNWDIKWICNKQTNPHFWIWDSKNGFGMALTGSTHKWEKRNICVWE